MAGIWKNQANQLHDKDMLVVSRWPYLLGSVPETSEKGIWINDFADIDHADCVIVYGKEGDQLRGALVEAGYAIAKGKRVFVLGEHECFGTWKGHPLVTTIAMPGQEDPIHNPDFVEKAVFSALLTMQYGSK
jgi:nucleoside 2-deoxyribosyltransferase